MLDSTMKGAKHSVRVHYWTYIFNSTKCSVLDCWVTILVFIT